MLALDWAAYGAQTIAVRQEFRREHLARPLRIEHVGGYYHITARGVARGTIFFDDEDREDFLQRLGEAHERWGLVIHGYALMTNHYHAEIETPEGNLSRAMQWLNHVYAAGVNRRHARVGHLFQGRFKCVLVEADTQLHRLTRYVHLNPVRAGMVDHPRDYRWSSYRAYVGRVKPPAWLDVSRTLSMFGRTRREQRRAYRQFVEEQVVENPLTEMVFGAVLGTREFVEWAQGKLDGMAEDREVAGLMTAFRRPTLDAICDAVAADYGVDVCSMRVRGRKKNEARDVAIYLSRECSGRKHVEVGRHFGALRPPTVSSACHRVETRMAEDKRWRRRVLRLIQQVKEQE